MIIEEINPGSQNSYTIHLNKIRGEYHIYPVNSEGQLFAVRDHKEPSIVYTITGKIEFEIALKIEASPNLKIEDGLIGNINSIKRMIAGLEAEGKLEKSPFNAETFSKYI